MRFVSKKAGGRVGLAMAYYVAVYHTHTKMYIKSIEIDLRLRHRYVCSYLTPFSMPHAGREEFNNSSITKDNQSRDEQNYNQRDEEHRHVEVLANVCANDWHNEASDGRTHG